MLRESKKSIGRANESGMAQRVGRNVRGLRQAQGLTLSELAGGLKDGTFLVRSAGLNRPS